MITKPQFKNITYHAQLPEDITGYESGTSGWTFEAEKGTCYAYEWVRDGQSLVVVPICNCEYTYNSPEQAAASHELLDFAIGHLC